MNLNTYIQQLMDIRSKYGGDLEVVYSTDEEGNSFGKVFYSPTVGCLSNTDHFEIDDHTEKFAKYNKINAVCIN